MSNDAISLRTTVMEETLADYRRNHELVTQTNEAIASRMVWFVALSGFALLNVTSLIEQISGTKPSGLPLILVFAPWVLTAFAGAVTNWLLAIVRGKDMEYYISKHAHMNALRITRGDDATFEEFSAVRDDQVEELATLGKSVRRYGSASTLVEKITFTSFALSFVWTAMAALVLF